MGLKKEQRLQIVPPPKVRMIFDSCVLKEWFYLSSPKNPTQEIVLKSILVDARGDAASLEYVAPPGLINQAILIVVFVAFKPKTSKVLKTLEV